MSSAVNMRLQDLKDSALQGIVEEALLMFDIGRCTLRREHPTEVFPVVQEAVAPGVRSLIGDTRVDLRGQPVVRVLSEGGDQVVQNDCRTAFDDEAFQRMLDAYGGLGAQIVTPVRLDGRLVAILSLHHLGSPRHWDDEEIELARLAAALIAQILGPTR